MRPRRNPDAVNGFTLIELMTVIALLAILSAIVAPSLRTFIENQRLRNASFDIVSDLLLARSEALTRQSVVVVTPSGSDSAGWSDGWAINLVSSAGAPVTNRTGLPGQLRFSVMNSSATAQGSLSFGPDGRVVGLTPMSIEVKYADPAPTGVSPSCVRIDATGRPKADKGACS
jgi:type IV fimbrial biogenesis protein FimT